MLKFSNIYVNQWCFQSSYNSTITPPTNKL